MNQLTQLFENFISGIDGYLPSTVGAILILIVGWFISRFLKGLITRLIKRTGVDEKLSSSKVVLSRFIGKLVYFLMMIFVFMLALDKLGMSNVLDPAKNLLNGFLNFIPNLVGAGLVAYIGYMLATIVSELVGLSGDTIRSWVPRLKLPENLDIVKILKKLVFIFVFIPLLISALNILKMDAISIPAANMLEQFFDAIPKILLAMVLMIVFVVGGRFVTQLLKELLDSLKLNDFVERMNLVGISDKGLNVSNLISNVAYFFIVVFGLLTAVEKLEFTRLTEILNTIINLSGNILFGLVILAIGNWVANLASSSFAKVDGNKFVGSIIRVAVLAIFLAMGLKTMGIADDIINLAFGITLGTLAVTIALSFGLGGREAAGKQMERILQRFNAKK